MIELPRACVVANELAEFAQFFSFGTNDLTQTTFGYSRDDAEASFIPRYLEKKVLADDPFQVLDRVGVGGLMRIAVERGRAMRSRPEDRHLRRTRRRTIEHRVLPRDRPGLRVLLAVPRSHRASGRGSGGTATEYVAGRRCHRNLTSKIAVNNRIARFR